MFLVSIFPILGAFAKLLKAKAGFFVSVYPSARKEQLGSHWMDFHKIWYLTIFRKPVKKIKI